jgi:FKBP-type peptidyl-prolyl cis-trans isomerase
MATPRSQRIGIWIIAIVMIIGTLGSFAVMVLANNNARNDQAAQTKAYAAYQQQQQQAAAQNAAKAEALTGYAPSPFTAADVTQLKVEILNPGTGATLKATDSINVSYFGWLASGQIFDSSQKSGKDTPIDLSLSGVIPGWTEGLTGQKVGSTVSIWRPGIWYYSS